MFARERVHSVARGDIGDDTEQYAQENISLDEDTSFSQLPTNEFSIPMQETASSPAPMASKSIITAKSYRKKKCIARDPAMDAMTEKFQQLCRNSWIGNWVNG